MSSDYAGLLAVAHEAVDLAARLMRTLHPGALTAKGDRDLASEVDYAIEHRLREFLAARTPDIGFLGEEGGRSGAADGRLWALDPVDGTVNFVHGTPLCAVSLGLIEAERSVVGVVDLPYLSTRYYAAEGHGAFADGEPIHVSGTTEIADALVAIGDYAVGPGSEGRNTERLAITRHLAARAQRVRMHGSAAIDLAWLAHGRLDAVVMLANKPWDTAAGVVIAREAGAAVFDAAGAPHTVDSAETIATSGALRGDILDIVEQARAAATVR